MIDLRRQEPDYEAVRKIALQQGFVMVQISPRKHQVIKLDTANGGYWYTNSGYRTWLSGEVVFTGNWEKCRDWLEANTPELPMHLL